MIQNFFMACGCACLLLLSGCASWTLDKSVVPEPSEVATIKGEIDKVINFQKAVYEISVYAVDRCEAKAMREPFTLITLGGLANSYKPQRLAAYYKAAALDEGWRVLWSDTQKSPLNAGTRVMQLNDRDLENNKTGAGEFPYVKYLFYTARARREAVDGVPFIITLETGKKVTIPVIPACDVQVWSMPIIEDSDYSEIPVNQFSPVVLPANAIRLALSQDEMRYLAGLAVYYGASSEAISKRSSGHKLMLGGAALIAAAPILYPIIAPITTRMSGGIAGDVTEFNAAHFSSQILIDMGGNPYAGLDLMARLESKKLGATRVLIPKEDRDKLRQYIATHASPNPPSSVLKEAATSNNKGQEAIQPSSASRRE